MPWTIGAVSVTAFIESNIPLPLQSVLPGASSADIDAIDWARPTYVSETDEIILAIQAFGIETPDMRILVDTCNGNDKNRPGGFGHMQTTNFLENLAAAGFNRERIDIVMCTHLHADHVGWNTMLTDGRWTPAFPNARYLIGRTDFEQERALAGEAFHEQFADSIQPVVEAGLVDLIESNHQICPELRLIPTPGHTPGHASVLIESQGERALITGDFIHNPVQIARPDWEMAFDQDARIAVQTRERMITMLADQPWLVFGTHFPQFPAGRILSGGDQRRFEPIA
jgi:glyoxylase-like metal-dependent hydrolase (beta-lactamase superfamily II)